MNTKKVFFAILPPLLFLLLALILAELSFQGQWVPRYLLPGPSTLLLSLMQESPLYLKAFSETLVNTLKGLSLSFSAGLVLAGIFSIFEILKRAILPFCLFFQTVPVVALAPLMVIWFGFGDPTVIASSAIVSFFPILANTLLGLNSARPEHRELFRSLKASRWQILIRLELPSAIPSLFAGLKISAGLAVIGAIVGEFVGGGGLGALIDSARTQQKIEMVFAAVLLCSFLGGLLLFCVRGLEVCARSYSSK